MSNVIKWSNDPNEIWSQMPERDLNINLRNFNEIMSYFDCVIGFYSLSGYIGYLIACFKFSSYSLGTPTKIYMHMLPNGNGVLYGDFSNTGDHQMGYGYAYTKRSGKTSPFENSAFTAWYNDEQYAGYEISYRIDENKPILVFKSPVPVYDENGEDITPVIHNYIPITYFVSPVNHTHLAQIKADKTNHGEMSESEISATMQSLGQAPNFSQLVADLNVNEQRTLVRVSDFNGASVKRLADSGSGKVYEVNYSINGVVQPTLTTTYTLEAGTPTFLSYLIDTENNAVRPSFVFNNGGMVTYNTENVTEAQQTLWYTWVGQLSTSPEQTGYMLGQIPDPQYFGGDSSDDTGGDGTYDYGSDDVPFGATPTRELTESGFMTLFAPTQTDIEELANYMWTDNLFDVSNFRKLFANPMDCIICLNILPFAIPTLPAKRLKVGNMDTSLDIAVAEKEFVEIDCGTVHVPKTTDSYLDYAPYTKISLYLPYINTVQISPDDVIGKDVTIKYICDILTGTCIAQVKVDAQVLYSFSGNCACQIPFSATSYSGVVNGLLASVGTIATLASGGLSAPLALGATGTLAMNVMNGKPEVQRGGGIGSTAGYMGVQKPHFIFTLPNQCKAKDQSSFIGYPSHTTYKLDDLSGYTVVEQIHLENLSCTEEERAEIENILMTGVIL